MTLSINGTVTEAAHRDIEELQEKINRFKRGEIPEDRFKAFRLTRGVYGQRQLGVQMFRIKVPFGKLTAEQLVTIADLSEKYTNGNLHATTRQNIQLHYVKLDDAPEMWEALERVGVTLREACGNTVRNITGSAFAGIDPKEPFDISPYAEAMFQHFLRNPVCQDMGRKIKSAFSSSELDSAFTYFHDFGFIPRVREGENGTERGFKVVIGGGLGAQAYIARTAYEFLPVDQIIPFKEAALRVFDRYGEREKRHKARLKFLLDDRRGMGIEEFMRLTKLEMKALDFSKVDIVPERITPAEAPAFVADEPEKNINLQKYQEWKQTNVFEQKQPGFYAVNIKLPLGNIDAETARKFAEVVLKYAADDIRITVNQGFSLRFVRPENLTHLFKSLDLLGLAETGFDTIADITACPGTDTCNLGVTNSTGIAGELEQVIRAEYPHLVTDSQITIKISGCMNSCGQHMAANIGFHGSSIKHGGLVIPALQVVLGGGVDKSGKGFIAEKVIKLPTKRIPKTLQWILDDYQESAEPGEYFNDYVQRLGKRYFYDMLKPLADLSEVAEWEYMDWGQDQNFVPEIGVGECAGVSYDMVGTIMNDARERIEMSLAAYQANLFAEAQYHAYTAMVIAAKGLLLVEDVRCNTHIGIIKDFDEHFVASGKIEIPQDFTSWVLEFKEAPADSSFTKSYIDRAQALLRSVEEYRAQDLEQEEKVVINNYYKA